ncbi:MAG: hypothetical protein ABSE07_04380 [Methanoregula sp.]|jgi:hypothetical protein
MIKKWGLLFVVLFLAGTVVISGCVSQQSTPQTTTVPSGTQTGTGTTVPTIKQPTPVSIPATGVFVKVSYLGAFNGTYGIDDVTQKVRNSGDRLYSIDNTTGNVSATFYKEDRSLHNLTVEIWKDSKLLTSATNSSAFGRASVIYQL